MEGRLLWMEGDLRGAWGGGGEKFGSGRRSESAGSLCSPAAATGVPPLPQKPWLTACDDIPTPLPSLPDY